ncbi:MAG: glycoside hydrolase family 97 catalytic domain-containing protein [Actinomycetota bacterium]
MRRARPAAAVAGVVAAAVTFSATSCSFDDDGSGRVVAPPTERTEADVLLDVVSTSHAGSDLRLDVGLLAGGTIAHRVVLDEPGAADRTVIDASPIGLDTSAGSFLDGLTVIDDGDPMPWTSSFASPTGRRRVDDLAGTIRTMRFASTPGDAPAHVVLELDVLATDHAVAFRTRLAAADTAIDTATDTAIDTETDIDQSGEIIEVFAERTSFDLDADATAWLQPHDEPGRFTPAYERIVPSGRPLATPVRSAQGWTLPALFEADDVWTLIAEAGLDRGWAGSHLAPTTGDGELFLALPDPAEGFGVGSSTPRGPLPLTSPWRIVLTSTDVGDLVESQIVRHLAEPADDRDWSWVQPGRVSWSWWADTSSPTDADRLIDYVEFSAEFGWEYSLIDANWTELADDEFASVVDRADELGVGLLLWYNSGGPHNDVTEAPRGLMSSPETRRAEMARIAELGVRGIKVDFFHSDKPDRIEQYLDVLADAADAELLVNFHGSTMPRGWSRTWPNLMTMEAVAGTEQYLFDRSYPGLAPAQHTVLPFLRNVAGPMDLTPTTFDPDLARSTSDAHELALAVLVESGLQHLGDRPEVYQAQLPEVRDALADLPVAWDDTVFLDGRPDEFVVLARRSGDEWWVAAIDGSDTERTIPLLDLLAADDRTAALVEPDASGAGRTTVLCDGDDRRSWAIETGPTPAEVRLLGDGGCLIRIGPR